jgi:DNA-directed RNA polymerase II subunit RPB2
MDPTVIKNHIYDTESAEAYLEKRPRRLNREGKDTPLTRSKKLQLAFLYQTFHKEFLPHVGNDFREKAFFLAYMTRKLLLHRLGLLPSTDKDNHQYKRFDLSGHMLAVTFQTALQQVQRAASIQIGRKYQFETKSYSELNFANIINPDTYKQIFSREKFIEYFTKSIKIGTFGEKKGVGKVLDRHCWPQTVSELRRIIDNATGRISEGRRRIHATQYGNICYVETPTGQNIGLNKHLAMLAYITSDIDAKPIAQLLLELGMNRLSDLTPLQAADKTAVFLNGKWVGCVADPHKFITILRLYRRNGLINAFISMNWETFTNEIKIWTDNGRMCHPNYILEGNQFLIQPGHLEKIRNKQIKFTDLLVGFHGEKHKLDYYLDKVIPPETIGFNKSRDDLIDFLSEKSAVIEYIDPSEMEATMMANDFSIPADTLQKYTHHEIHSSMALGASAHLMSYANNNNGARNLIATKHVRQGMGLPLTNYRNRIDGKMIVLHNPQRPLTLTRISKHLLADKLSCGQNLVVAIGVYAGFNEDDAVCANRASCEMGMLNCTLYKSYEETEKYDPKTQVGESFYNPILRYAQSKKTEEEQADGSTSLTEYPKGLIPKDNLNYTALDNYGFIKEGTYLKGDEVIIGKFMKFQGDSGQTEEKDMSTTVMTDGDETMIDKVFTYVNDAEGHRTVKVRTAQYLGMSIGDKMGSRCDQKGAIGELLSREDMPYTEDGLTPDIIINPFTYCKRMTVNQLIELMFGNIATKLGCYGDCSPMMPVNLDNLVEVMDDLGLHFCGDRTLYSGITGQQMQVKIFMGTMFYQRLFYMPRYKINARNSGAREQGIPVPGAAYSARDRSVLQGRSKEGGLKIGEMERDCLLAHGVMTFLKESMIERGDKFVIYVSRYSGFIVIGNPHEKIFMDTVADGPVSFHLRDNTSSVKNNVLGINTINQRSMEYFKVEVPFSFKQLIYELQGMMYRVRLSDRVLQKLDEVADEGDAIDIFDDESGFEMEDEDIILESGASDEQEGGSEGTTLIDGEGDDDSNSKVDGEGDDDNNSKVDGEGDGEGDSTGQNEDDGNGEGDDDSNSKVDGETYSQSPELNSSILPVSTQPTDIPPLEVMPLPNLQITQQSVQPQQIPVKAITEKQLETLDDPINEQDQSGRNKQPVVNLTVQIGNQPLPNNNKPEVKLQDNETKLEDVITSQEQHNGSEPAKSVSINPEVRVITIDTNYPPMSGGGGNKNGNDKAIYHDLMDPYEKE